MPELGPMMRALELQRLIEDKVTEWRERSARVAGVTMAESYQQPLNFKRHTNRRKNSAEINRIIAKYSKPNKRTVERHIPLEKCIEVPPTRPARHKKLQNNLKLSKSEDNLASIGVMDVCSNPAAELNTLPKFNLAKYDAKSCEDVTAFVDFDHSVKSKNFEENSILNAKAVSRARPTTLHCIGEDMTSTSEFSDSGVEFRNHTNFLTSTPISTRKTCPPDSLSVADFDKCKKHASASESELRKGSSEPDILSQKSVGSSKTLDAIKKWKLLKPRFRKGTFDCILRWRGKKPHQSQSK